MTGLSVLVVDDEQDLARVLAKSIERLGCTADYCNSVEQAKDKISTSKIDFILTDLNMGNDSGVALVSYVSSNHPHIKIAVMTAYGGRDMAVAALRLGALDFINKPIEPDVLKSLIEDAEKAVYQDLGRDQNILDELIGASQGIEDLKYVISRVSKSLAPVFIQGESGVGKEVVAGLIHKLSSRADKPFIAINCGAIPNDLIESELFGHKKGSFTGATHENKGLIKAAHGGTLFLDEIAELPYSLQVRLLRVIQEKKIRPIGSTEEEFVDFRLISATHQNLDEMVKKGTFRQDLFFRLHVMDIQIPPLRERGEDVLMLADHFCQKICKEWGLPKKKISPAMREWMLKYPFHGNVRELQNIIQKSIALSEGDLLDIQGNVESPALADADLLLDRLETAYPPVEGKLVTGRDDIEAVSSGELYIPLEEGLEAYLDGLERQILEAVMQDAFGKIIVAAKKLKLSPRSLRYRLAKYKITAEED